MVTCAELNAHAIGREDWSIAVVAIMDRDATPTIAAVADVRGCFAIHRAVSKAIFNDEMTLTHLPTGTALGGCESAEALRLLASDLEAVADWNFTNPSEAPAEIHAKARDVIRKFNVKRAAWTV